MISSYNKLWKIPIDKGITETEKRKQAGISTNIIAKRGKSEAVSMDTLAKICVALECTLDDILEIKNYESADIQQ